ncbi:MAG: hypothetical protein JXA77_15705 [Bacteroidales bacterium]|nr:hypothetical protein [Bacteroidales bacterium]MBN2821476.1 hypothetical protein [Bacteroidales bacterium]
MHFEKEHVYHIYNQGNNRQEIFFKRENYLFFLRKVRAHMLPYCDVFAWCLMPNHFHFLVRVNEVELTVREASQAVTLRPATIQGVTQTVASLGMTQKPVASQGVTQSHTLTKKKLRTFNDSIGILLRSYTRAINKQEGTTGSLFRNETKASCLSCPEVTVPEFLRHSGQKGPYIYDSSKEYLNVCFNYIHQNPVNAGLVNKPADWEFSSAQDYAMLRNGSLINKKLSKEYEIT